MVRNEFGDNNDVIVSHDILEPEFSDDHNCRALFKTQAN